MGSRGYNTGPLAGADQLGLSRSARTAASRCVSAGTRSDAVQRALVGGADARYVGFAHVVSLHARWGYWPRLALACSLRR